jgi:hypothetical protein
MVKADDEEQLEYIRKWCEMKEQKKEEKEHRKRMRKHYLSMAKWHLSYVVTELKCYFELLFRKGRGTK